jgi:hypothetical protein
MFQPRIDGVVKYHLSNNGALSTVLPGRDVIFLHYFVTGLFSTLTAKDQNL